MTHSVVVTGAATGIGRATVEAAVHAGAQVFAGVRRPEDASALSDAFGAAVTPLMLDVCDPAQVSAAAATVGAALGDRRLSGLVNNAGIAVAGPLLHLPIEDLRRQIEVNLIGVHRMTQAFAPLLGADPARQGPPGRIVMISSIAGRLAMPFLGAYAASKHGLEGYSDSLRRELMLYGIDVLVVGPGAVATPIWDKAEADDLRTRYGATAYGPVAARLEAEMLARGRAGLPAAVVGARVWRLVTQARPPARTALLRHRFAQYSLPLLAPKRLVDRVIAAVLGLKRLR